MVLEPFAAVSLASAVVQFVHFGTKLISKGNELYQSPDGVLADQAEYAGISSRIADLTSALSTSMDACATLKESSPAQKALQEVTVDCKRLAEDFIAALNELGVTGNHRKWKSFRQALKSVWKKQGIEERLVKLDHLHQLVMVHLLVVINESQTNAFADINRSTSRTEDNIIDGIKLHLDEIQQQIENLTEGLSNFPKKESKPILDDQPKNMTQEQLLVDGWRAQNKVILRQILESVSRRDEDQKTSSFRQKILDHLYFETIGDRHEMIDGGHRATLEWVFNPSLQTLPQLHDIPSWLQGSDGLYWVSGKAGSGKSSLMKWLLHEDRTKKLLEGWSGDKPLLLASYFFWSSGTDLQKSLSGLLRSLLHELLQQWNGPITKIFPAMWRSHDLELEHFPSWTKADLLTALQVLLQQAAETVGVCLFIDGLDEFVGDHDQRIKITNLLEELSGYRHIKICISSRPWEIFKDAFASRPSLRLEELTRKDIESYTNSELETSDKFKALQQENNTLCSELVSEILDKAKGVWLWVILVVRSLLRGLGNRDTVEDLLYRLRQIPEELEEYFLQMFSNIETCYRTKALKLLKIALYSPRGLSLMTCSFLDEDDTKFPFETPMKAVPEDELKNRLRQTESRVNIFCLDLLDIVSPSRKTHLFYSRSVEFLHRTAQDFLLDPNTQRLVKMESVSSFNVNLFMCKSLLAQIKMTETPSNRLLDDFMRYAVLLEEEKESSQLLPPLLSQLNQVLECHHRFTSWSNELWLEPCPVKSLNSADQGRRLPLLSLAIQYGLTSYAKANLRAVPGLVAQQSTRPLLDFALRRRVYDAFRGQAEQVDGPVGGVYDLPDIELVRLILDLGGDPNERLGHSTVWKCFLGFLDVFAEDIRDLDEECKQIWVSTTELLIRYGASSVLETKTIIPEQPAGRPRVKRIHFVVLARTRIAAAFGEPEAVRLNSLSLWLNISGQNLLIKINRILRYLFSR